MIEVLPVPKQKAAPLVITLGGISNVNKCLPPKTLAVR